MDSITQGVLGAGIAGALGAKKLGNKALRRGIGIATIPDLDVFIGPLLYPDNPILADFFHRGPMHSLLFCVLIAPIVALIINRIHSGDRKAFLVRLCVVFGALITHPFLDSLTNYGTQLLRPFTDTAYSLNSIFIVDPLYTLPFLGFIVAALFAKTRQKTAKRATRGVFISTLYLLIAIGIKFYAQAQFVQTRADQNIICEQSFTTPEVMQILLRKHVAVCDGNIYQGRYSIFDNKSPSFILHPIQEEIIEPYLSDENILQVLKRIGGYGLYRSGADGIWIYDMRFGQIAGWNNTGDTFSFFAYRIDQGSDGLLIQQTSQAEQRLPARPFHILRERIKGD